MLAVRAVPAFASAIVALMLATSAHLGARADDGGCGAVSGMKVPRGPDGRCDPGARGATPLHRATTGKNADPAAAAALLAAGADADARDERGRTPLHRAAHNPDPAVVAALLKAGADVNACAGKLYGGMTPLHRAAARRNANPAVVAALVAAGADVNARDERGRTPR